MSKLIYAMVGLFVSIIVYRKYRVLKQYKEDMIDAQECLEKIEGQVKEENRASTIWIYSWLFGVVGLGVFGVIAMLTGKVWVGMGVLAGAGLFFTVYFAVAVLPLGWINHIVTYSVAKATEWYLPQEKISGLEDAAERVYE